MTLDPGRYDRPMDILREPRISLIARPQFLEPAHLPIQWKGEAATASGSPSSRDGSAT